MQESNQLIGRRHDIDALRVLAFSFLIFYHIGMFYVANWGYHVKSNYRSEWLENLMLLVNPWRLPLLFLISGIAMRFALRKRSIIRFLGLRHWRLLLPLAFGVLVIVPPQLYFEMTQNGDLQMSYWQFYQAFFDLDHPAFENYQAGILPHMDVNHLWYIRELWTFTIYLLLLLPVLHHDRFQSAIDWLGQRAGTAGLLLATALPTACITLLADSDSESQRKALGFVFLAYGYLLGWHPNLWNRVKSHRRTFLLIAVISYLGILGLYHWMWLPGGIQLTSSETALLVLFRSIGRWSWVLAILGYAAVYLNQTSKVISYLNEAVYPYYILHQTIIVVAGYQLTQLRLGPVIEPLLLILITVTSCLLIHEYVIRRTRFLRPLFGLKMTPRKQHHADLVHTS